MPLSNLTIGAQVAFTLTSINPGFQPVVVSDKIEYIVKPDVDSVNHIVTKQITIESGIDHELDVYEFIDLVRDQVEADSVYGIILTVTGVNGECTLSPGVSDGLEFPDNGSRIIRSGGMYCYFQPTAFPVSSSARILQLSNTGTGTMTVRIGVIVGA